MLIVPDRAGPQNPVTETPRRAAPSVRRTSSIDTHRPDGLAGKRIVDARARDLHTTADGSCQVVGEARLRAVIDPSLLLVTIETEPARPALDPLIGGLVGPGFRARMDELVPAERQAHSLLYLLLDDLPGATLVSGYANHHAGTTRPSGQAALRVNEHMVRRDMCAGWADDATIMRSIRSHDEVPMPVGPWAPALERDDDPQSWHAMEALGPLGMRRRRRLDLSPGAAPAQEWRIDAHFRDSHVDGAGTETVLHEYSVTGTVDPATLVIGELGAVAQVLPWVECPGAVGSAGRLAGHGVDDLRPWVRREFLGVTTCTHLNDTLRSLSDLRVLRHALGGVGG